MRRDLGLGLLLTALTLAVYWPVRTHHFIAYDDPQLITENTRIQSGLSWETLVYAFTMPVAGNWHPVTTLSHALDCELFGLNSEAHHLVNALLHALNASLLFLALQQLTPSLARATLGKTENQLGRIKSQKLGGGFAGRNFVIAALFALHPLRVESVAWLAERKDLLAGSFFLLSLWLYAIKSGSPGGRPPGKGNRESGKGETGKGPKPAIHRSLYLSSLLCFGLGLMSKPMVVTLPFVLLLLDYWPLRRLRLSQFSSVRGLLYEKIPFFLLSGVVCWITLRVQKGAGAMQIVSGITWPERLANAITSYTRYLGKMFWPTDLAVILDLPAMTGSGRLKRGRPSAGQRLHHSGQVCFP